MYNKDISICKRVILDMINELKQKEEKNESRLALMKALKIINKEKPNK